MFYCLDCHTEFDEPTIETILGGDCKESQDIDYVQLCPCCNGENYLDDS